MARYARAEAVKAIDNELQKCPDNLRDLLIAARELTLGGAPASVTLPLWDRYRNALAKDGKKPRPLLDRAHLTGLVAVVDLIAGRRRGVDAVINKVAKAAGVSPKDLKNQRLRWQRGAIDNAAPYNFLLVIFEGMTEDEILAELRGVRAANNFVPNPS
jgi:hypothetical protein